MCLHESPFLDAENPRLRAGRQRPRTSPSRRCPRTETRRGQLGIPDRPLAISAPATGRRDPSVGQVWRRTALETRRQDVAFSRSCFGWLLSGFSCRRPVIVPRPPCSRMSGVSWSTTSSWRRAGPQTAHRSTRWRTARSRWRRAPRRRRAHSPPRPDCATPLE